MRKPTSGRRGFLRAAVIQLGAVVLAGCDRLSSSKTFQGVLDAGQWLSRTVHPLVAGQRAMAQEFTEADISMPFRANGTRRPRSAAYQAQADGGFVDWVVQVDGLVAHPAQYRLAELRAMPSRTQITRHDCVEGWSAIGKWTGVQLSRILDQVQPTAAARYVVFHCADPMKDDGTEPYYESIDLTEAHHPQTILAYELNGQKLPVQNGAPLRLRVERQLGYKHAKYVMRIELVESFAGMRGGEGGYWEDKGYQWYAGI